MLFYELATVSFVLFFYILCLKPYPPCLAHIDLHVHSLPLYNDFFFLNYNSFNNLIKILVHIIHLFFNPFFFLFEITRLEDLIPVYRKVINPLGISIFFSFSFAEKQRCNMVIISFVCA